MKALKKLLLIFSVFLFTFFGEIAVNLACGPEADPYDYYTTFFHNNTSGDEYSSFAYNQLVYLYNDHDFETEAEVNGNEWSKYLGVKKDDVIKVMYHTDSATSALISRFNLNSFVRYPDSLKKNTFLKGLMRNVNAKRYFHFAKSCEPFIAINFDYWNVKEKDSAAMIQKGCDALDSIHKVKDDSFLKLRYAFQAQRMFRYAGDYAQADSTYSQQIKHLKTNSAVQGWALAIYAGTLNNKNESAYLFSRVFDQNPEKRVLAYKNYRYTRSNIAEVLKFTRNDKEKAVVVAINGFGHSQYNLDTLKTVYQLNPKSLLNGALLNREVNKLEEKLIQNERIALDYYENYYARWHNPVNMDSLRKAELSNLRNVRNFAVKLASEKKYPQPELGMITAAYLSWMEKNDALAIRYLNKLKPNKLPERLKAQYFIIDLLIKARKIKNGNSFNENDLVPTLNWLDKKRFEENEIQPEQDYYNNWGEPKKHFTKTTRNFYMQILAPALLRKGDTARAALAMLKADSKFLIYRKKSLVSNLSYPTITFWQKALSSKTMEKLAGYRLKKNLSQLDSLLSSGFAAVGRDDFYELFGTAYLRSHKYHKALTMLNQVSPNFNYMRYQDWSTHDSTYYANPFIQKLNDYPKKYVLAKTGFSKKTFAKEMLNLQRLIITDRKNAASYYFKMANAIYQTGYFGNAWHLISYNWSSQENYQPVKYGYELDYKQAHQAKQWYLKARELSTNPDFKAKCTFMLAKCAQKEIIAAAKEDSFHYWERNSASYKSFMEANYNNPYFKELKFKYSKTPFYQVAAGECSYLKDFISRN